MTCSSVVVPCDEVVLCVLDCGFGGFGVGVGVRVEGIFPWG